MVDNKFYAGFVLEVLSLLSTAIKYLIFKTMQGLSVDYYVFNCCVIMLSCFFTAAVLTVEKRDITVDMFSEKYLHVARGLTSLAAFLLMAKTYQLIPAADASAIFKSAPVFVTVFAYLFLKERFGLRRIVLLVLTLIGIVLICRPTFIFSSIDESNDRLSGTLYGVAACILLSILYLIRRRTRSTSVLMMSVTNSTVFVILMFPVVLYRSSWRTVDCSYGIWLVLCGVLAVSASLLKNKASRMEDASRLALFGAVDLPFTFLAEFAMFGTNPKWTSYSGAVVLIASSILVVIIKKRETVGLRNRAEEKEGKISDVKSSESGV